MREKAMILAAGLGKRLGEITRDRPKALVEVYGVPLLEIILQKLRHQGFDDVVINIHHHAELIKKYLGEYPHKNMTIQLSEERENPLETGGGVKHARELLLDAAGFLIHNVDILTDMDLRELVKVHADSGAPVTLAVSRRETSRYLLADEDNFLCGWKNISTGEKIMTRKPLGDMKQWGYSGVAALSREVLFLLPDEDIFSLTTFFLELSRKRDVKVFAPHMSFWFDIGKPGIIDTLEKAFPKDKLLKY